MNKRILPRSGGRVLESLRIPFALLPVLAAAIAIEGCGSRVACLEWSADRGACPSSEEAFKRFGGQSCAADILSVDSEAEADETGCCYDVTKRGAGELNCVTTGGANPTGGIPTGGSTGSSGSCGRCAAFQAGQASELCESSDEIFNNLVTCLCSGACAEACDDGSCSTTTDSSTCQACATDTGGGCGPEMAACENDI
jgi:hypothetical protein